MANKKNTQAKTGKTNKECMCGGECSHNSKNAGLFIPGGLLFGIGMGFVFGNVPAGLFIGLGTGFIIFAVLRILMH